MVGDPTSNFLSLLGNKAILTMALQHWKEFVNLQRERKKVIAKAVGQYEQVLIRYQKQLLLTVCYRQADD